jgi:broad specificity phosphatase PhoE
VSGRLVLLRHGQSYGNIERRLDTRPPGAALTPLGRDQALAFAQGSGRPAMLAHSVAIRASETAAVIGAQLEMLAYEVADIHEVQVGELENRSDDDAVAEFNTIYERWHHVIVSHGAAIRLASAVLAGVDANFALDNHLDNAESVVLAPITDGRWSCVRWGALTPPFYPKPDSNSVTDAVTSSSDPMG